MLSPYLCFISFIYLDLYILGDDTTTGLGSFMQNKHLCVLIHISNNGKVGIVKHVFGPSVMFLLNISRRCFFVAPFLPFLCHGLLLSYCLVDFLQAG